MNKATFWSAMIFCLDRFITNTMYSDGKVSISKQEFFSGLPRIVIAIFLGIIISAPLELKIFGDTISMKMKEQFDQEKASLIKDNTTQYNDLYKIKRERLQNQANQLNTQIKVKDSTYLHLSMNPPQVNTEQKSELYTISSKQTVDTLTGKVLTDRQQGVRYSTVETDASKTARGNQAIALDRTKKELDSLRVIYNSVCDTLTNIDKLMSADIKKAEDEINERFKEPDDGLNRQLDVLHDLAMEEYEPYNREENTWLDYITLHPLWYYLLFSPIGLIMLLFILIDISPVLYKMMLADGKYDNYMHQDKLLAQDKIRLSLAKMLKHLNDSELKRVAPFVMGDIYEKMAGDSFIYKTEEEYQNEHLAQKPIHWAWRIWPLSMLRWMFWKEEDKPSAPVIVMEDKRVSKNEETLHEVNDKVFNEVLDMKRRLILASYRRWYKTQYYQLDPNGDDGIVPPPDNFPEGDGGYDGANGYGPNNENIPPSGGGTSTKEEDEEINIDGSYMDSEKERDHSSYEHEINDDETTEEKTNETEEKGSSFDNSKYEREVEEDDKEIKLNNYNM